MKKNIKIIIGLIVSLIFVLGIFYLSIDNVNSDIKEMTYNQFWEKVNNEEIKEVKINLNEDSFYAISKKDNKEYKVQNPKYDNFKKDLLEKNIKIEETHKSSFSIFNIISLMYPIAVIILLIISIKSMSPNNLFQSNKTEVTLKPNVKFSDVAGLKPVKKEMEYLVDFLKNPKKYVERGAKLPKGAILYGPPGTGKTLLAKAIAGEAGVPFFNVSGSQFVEMFVGRGAKRVRDLFETARKNAPCIIFIDEIDAVGKTRNGVGSNDEREQTLNQLLTEMDGFNGTEGIIVLCATNRIETLDNALIRPGRFDKHICVPLPSTSEERLEIINLYRKNKPFSDDVDFVALSKETIGFSPADIEVLLNESAIISVQEGKEIIDKDCIDKAIFQKVLKGHAKEDKERDENEIRLVAYHEIGHAFVGIKLGMDIPKVTIVPSTSGAGGVTFINPTKMGLYSLEEIENQIKMAYGGRAAEKLLLKDNNKVTTGAQADIIDATEKIKNMVVEYGMTEKYGLVNLNVLNLDSNIIMDEVVRISKKLYLETENLLNENEDIINLLTTELIKKETMTGEELKELIHSL